jgi:Short C-terminal domain
MLGHKWEPAEGTIVEAQTLPGHRHGIEAALHAEHRYVIEVRKPTGETIRGTVTEKSMRAHVVGQTVRVEVHGKNNEIRLDPNARTNAVSDMMNMAEQMRGAAGGMGATGAVGAAGLAGALGAMLGGTGAPSVHVIGPGGQELPLGALQGAGEVGGLAQAMMSGDPAARQAAIDRLRQIKAQAHGESAGQTGQPAPSTFDDIGPANTAGTFGDPVRETFSQPPAPSPYSQPAAPSSFSQSTTPSSFGQVTPPTSFGSPSAFDSFGGGAAAGSSQERIAKLQQLLDKGILTESEFQTQRQQVLNGG